MKIISRVFGICVTLFIISLEWSCTGDNTVTLSGLVEEMVSKEAITCFPDPAYSLKQFSSYDRKSVSVDGPGWFANSDYSRFIREENNNGRREFVLFDHTGPGAVVRWWMTFAGEGSYDGTIRVYIDGAEKPAIEGKAPGILSGNLLTVEPLASSVSPLSEYLKRGHNLYLPIPYSGSCKITYECEAVTEENGRIRPSIYYNINYREYETGTRVVSFSGSELQKATDVINRAAVVLSSAEPVQPAPERIKFSIEPGRSYIYTLKKKNTAINSIGLTLEAADLQQALRSTVVTASFDGRQTVWVPAGDFFGTGTMISPYETFFSRVEPSGEMVFERIMPFKKSFELSLVNYGDQVVEGEFSVSVTGYDWRPSSMYFGSSWHEYRGIKAAGSEYAGGTGDHFDINFIDINGKGVYAGDEVVVFNTEDAWWGEGDEKIFVDGDTFPSSFGTGTEDYYGYAWCLPGVFSHPFIAQPRGDGNFHPGLTVNLRHRSLDAIPFRDNISSNIELWHWAPAVINYALTTWYYTLPGSTSNQAPDPESVMSRVARSRTDLVSNLADEEGNLEGENIEFMYCSGGSVETQYITEWDWSNKGQLWWFGGSAGDTLILRFRSPATGRYTITGRLTMAPDYGIVRYFFNNMPSILFNGYSAEEKVIEVSMGDFILIEGDNIVKLVIEGKDSRAKEGFMAGIDQLRFTPL